MRERGWEVTGVEPSPGACANARRGLGLSVHCGTLGEVSWSKGSFDVVTAWHVLEHCPDPSGTLAEIHRILRHGGLFMGEVPNAAGWGARLFGDHWYHWDVPRHLYSFTPATLRRLLENAGFTRYRLLFVPDVKGLAGSIQYLTTRRPAEVRGKRIKWNRGANALLWPVALLAAAVRRSECLRVIALKGFC